MYTYIDIKTRPPASFSTRRREVPDARHGCHILPFRPIL